MLGPEIEETTFSRSPCLTGFLRLCQLARLFSTLDADRLTPSAVISSTRDTR